MGLFIVIVAAILVSVMLMKGFSGVLLAPQRLANKLTRLCRTVVAVIIMLIWFNHQGVAL